MAINFLDSINITGLDGGVALDVQGSQGQLFSVTDDLSGDIFAVSDISGVPILNVNSNGTSYFDGKLGIGTASPIAKLSVLSTSTGYSSDSQIKISDGSTSYYGGLSFDDAGSTRLSVRNSYDGTGAIVGFGFGGSSDKVQIINGTGLIVNEGDVGIGTTSPGEKLEVAGTNVGISVNGTTSSRIYYNRSGAYTWSTGLRSGDTKFHIFDERSGDRLIIDDNGNVGIGTTSPAAATKLEVAGGTKSTFYTSDGARGFKQDGVSFVSTYSDGSDASQANDIGSASNNWRDGYLSGNLTIGSTKLLKFGGNGARIYGDNNNKFLTFDTDSLERMRISNIGNVGIGTTSPTDLLMVDGNARVTGTLKIADGAYNAPSIAHRADEDTGIYFPANDTIGISTAASERMRITSTGLVGIGTTNPSDKLHVEGVIQSKNYLLPSTSGTAGWYKIGTMESFVQGGATALIEIVGHDGYNAINTQDYLIKLFIKTSNGTGSGPQLQKFNSWYERTGGNATNTIQFKWDNSATNDYDLYMFIPPHSLRSYYSVAKGTGTWENIGTSATDPGANSATVLKATSLFNILDTNVGIGTNSPTDKLDVIGNVNILNNKLYNGASNNSAGLEFIGSRTNIHGYHGITFNSSNAGIGSQAERMRITSAGDVGIGSTAPNYKLSVSGGIEAGGVVTYSKVAGSLNTTGYAIAGLGTVFNGASAFFTFTASGGIGQYQKVVYSCAGVGTNWVVNKVIDEGTNVLDIEASSSSAATIVFTFKTRSGTQSYSPRVVIEATGHSIISTYA